MSSKPFSQMPGHSYAPGHAPAEGPPARDPVETLLDGLSAQPELLLPFGLVVVAYLVYRLAAGHRGRRRRLLRTAASALQNPPIRRAGPAAVVPRRIVLGRRTDGDA